MMHVGLADLLQPPPQITIKPSRVVCLWDPEPPKDRRRFGYHKDYYSANREQILRSGREWRKRNLVRKPKYWFKFLPCNAYELEERAGMYSSYNAQGALATAEADGRIRISDNQPPLDPNLRKAKYQVRYELVK